MKQADPRTITLRLDLARVDLIQLGIDPFEILSIGRMKILATGSGCNRVEHILIQFLFTGCRDRSITERSRTIGAAPGTGRDR